MFGVGVEHRVGRRHRSQNQGQEIQLVGGHQKDGPAHRRHAAHLPGLEQSLGQVAILGPGILSVFLGVNQAVGGHAVGQTARKGEHGAKHQPSGHHQQSGQGRRISLYGLGEQRLQEHGAKGPRSEDPRYNGRRREPPVREQIHVEHRVGGCQFPVYEGHTGGRRSQEVGRDGI